MDTNFFSTTFMQLPPHECKWPQWSYCEQAKYIQTAKLGKEIKYTDIVKLEIIAIIIEE